MALWDSADLLAKCREESQEGEAGTVTTDAQWYSLLTRAQFTVYRLFALHCPHVIKSGPTAMTSSDGGYTYATPSSAYVMGWAEILDGRAGDLLTPGADFNPAADFVWEGNQIRITGGRTRTFSNGLYINYVAEPGEVSAASEPTLKPPSARILMVYEAVRQWAGQGALRDPREWEKKYRDEAFGDGLSPGIIGTLVTQLANQGADNARAGARLWWRSGDFRR